MESPAFDKLYRYDELTRLLNDFAQAYPDLARLESIGQSYEGRDIWLLTLTNTKTGPDTEKPALWVDGNLHASETAPTTACLHHIYTMLNQYGQNEAVTRCLDTRVFYVCPRVNPDGAELALADQPKILRSGTRPYPYDEDPIDGLIPEDIDGDGRILMMRIQDPDGAWKKHPDEPRLLVRRGPTEIGGTYYRLLPEGHIENYDGATITIQQPKERLDFNRNFPASWRTENEQRGAGPYPASEPEVRNVVDFIAKHPNITGGITFHTMSGVLLRPFSHKPDTDMIAEDLWTYQKIGEKGTAITDYPNISVYHDFRYHPNEVITGALDDWLYDHRGVFGWTVEIWSPMRKAGISEYKFIDWYREHPVEDDLKMLKWSDEELEGQGYVAWYPYEHPQLGQVELGGWDQLYAFRNPPPKYLAEEVALFTDWLLWHLLISPRLVLHEAGVTALGDQNYRVRLVLKNEGWLPSYITKHALKRQAVRGVVCELTLPEGASLRSGHLREILGQLEGRAYKPSAPSRWASDSTDDRVKVEWVIHAPQGGTVQLRARHERAGVLRAELSLAG